MAFGFYWLHTNKATNKKRGELSAPLDISN